MDSTRVENELLPFLEKDARMDLRVITLQNILGLTGSEEGRELLSECPQIMERLVGLLEDEQAEIAKETTKAITNLATYFPAAFALVTSHIACVLPLFRHVLNPQSATADAACIALCNLTRTERSCQPVAEAVEHHPEVVSLPRLLDLLCKEQYNTAGCSLKYLGPLVCNLSQSGALRQLLLAEHHMPLLQPLLPFTGYQLNLLKRAGVVGTLKNCCFETSRHEWLLSDRVDLLPRLLLPLAGPEEFSEEQNELLPPDLQYLEPDKTREPDPDIRKMLIEAVYLLCATTPGRKYVRSKNTYIILKAMDSEEKEKDVKLALHKLIALLIQDDPEEGFQNLRDVAIPDALWQRFDKDAEESPLFKMADVDAAAKATEEGKGFWVK